MDNVSVFHNFKSASVVIQHCLTSQESIMILPNVFIFGLLLILFRWDTKLANVFLLIKHKYFTL